MKQLVIRDSDENLIAKVSKVLSCSAEDTLANAKTLSFTTLLEGGLENLREEMRYTVEFENDLYDIVSFKKSMSGNLCFIEISCEHVSYRLNDKKLDMYSKTGTAKEVLTGLLEGTGFLAGTEELSREVTYSSQTSGTVRAVLLDFAGSFGYEVVFHRYTVSLVPHRADAKDTKILNGNVLEINKTIDLTQKHLRGRLAESLLLLKERYGVGEDGVTINISLTREDLANMSNMTTSNAIRTLSNFSAAKLIASDGRKIKLLREDELRKISKLE